MQQIILILIVLALPMLLASHAVDDEVRKELKALEGTWKAVSMEANGAPVPAEAAPGFTFIVGAGGKSTGKMAGSEYGATISVDPAKNPRTIDMLHDSGGQKGKRQYGVYKLEGDKWTVCMTGPGAVEGDRPKDFATKGTQYAVFVFERVKEEKKPGSEPRP